MRCVTAFLLGCSLLSAQVESRTVVTKGSGYFPVAVKLKSGETLVVLRGGAPHVGVKGRLDMVSTRDGKKWSAPWTVADGEFDDRNPAMGQLQDGTVLLAYVIAKGYDSTGLKFTGERNQRIFDGVYVIRSSNRGKTWSQPVRSEDIFKFYDGKGHVSPYGKIVQLPSGVILMAVYFEFFDQRGNESYVYRSRDNGKTWNSSSLIAKGYNETGLAVLADGRVIASLRSEKGGHLAVAMSNDDGFTWSPPKQVTADHEHPADLIVLRNGRIIMTYGERNAPRGAKAILSDDDGKTWNESTRIVLGDDAPNTDCGYPSSVELSGGRILTVYYQVDDAANALATSKSTAVIWRPAKLGP